MPEPHVRKNAHAPRQPPPVPPRTGRPTTPPPAAPAGRGKGRPPGKRSDPAYQPTTVLLRQQTKKLANRLLEDGRTGQDLSDLIEHLLRDWIQQALRHQPTSEALLPWPPPAWSPECPDRPC